MREESFTVDFDGMTLFFDPKYMCEVSTFSSICDMKLHAQF